MATGGKVFVYYLHINKDNLIHFKTFPANSFNSS